MNVGGAKYGHERVLAEFDGRHVVMADLEGNEFCVAPARSRGIHES